MSWILRVIFMLPMVSGIVVAQEADTSNTLENVVIEESFEGEFGEEKPPIKLDLDFSDIVAFSDNLSWRSIDHILGSADNRKEIGMRLRLSSPYLANIRPAPVKNFHVRFKNILRWQLDITASDGSLFRTISGNGTPPGTIAWDGRSNSGGVLAAGENYAYSFTAVDKAGNKRTFPGETFSVPAFYLQEEEHLLIGVAYSLLFSEEYVGLKRQAQTFAREIANLIRNFSTTGKISVSGDHESRDDFLSLITEELVCDLECFERRVSSPRSSSGFEFEVQ